MDQDERYEALQQRLSTLEAKVESLEKLVDKASPLFDKIDEFTKIEALVDRLQDNFLMVADVDTFRKLRDLLADKKFKEADQETAQILLDVVGKTADTITPDDIQNFPVAPLRIVDRLWRKYSNDRFGLSVQLKQYRDVGGDLNTLIAQDMDLFLRFCDRIGWRQDGKLIVRDNWEASLDSPEGFLPMSWWITPYGLKIGTFILARLIKTGF